MFGALADVLLGPLTWLVGAIVAAIGVWWAATSRANNKAFADRLARDLKQHQQQDEARKEIQNAINNSKSGGAGWHDRLSKNAAKRGRGL